MAPQATTGVAARWHRLVNDLGVDAAAADTELAALVSAYTDPARHYHDIRHIAALLALSQRHRAALADPAAIDLAILYHDAVYDPSRHHNEAASAALARERLMALGAPARLVDNVASWIEATDHAANAARRPPGADRDLDHLLDFDLSILAAAPADYDAYAAAIRREYGHYSDASYREGRAAVLRRLLSLPALYRVPELASAWTSRARSNLARELAALD